MGYPSVDFQEIDEELVRQIERLSPRFKSRLLAQYEQSAGGFRDEVIGALAEYEGDDLAPYYEVETFLKEKKRELSYEDYLDLMDFQMSTDAAELKEIFRADVPADRLREFQEGIHPLKREEFFQRPVVSKPANNLGLYQRHRPRGAMRSQLARWERNRHASVYDRWEVFSKHNEREEIAPRGALIEPGAPMRSRDEYIRNGSRAKLRQLLGINHHARYVFYDGMTGDPNDFDRMLP